MCRSIALRLLRMFTLKSDEECVARAVLVVAKQLGQLSRIA
jgi:hypothetical protein